MVKYCGQCGRVFKENQKFCASCGWSITDKHVQKTEKPFEINRGKDRGHQGLLMLLVFTILIFATAIFFTTETGENFKENIQGQWETIVNKE